MTPTGAAIVAAVRTDEQLPKHFQVKRSGSAPESGSMKVPDLTGNADRRDGNGQRPDFPLGNEH